LWCRVVVLVSVEAARSTALIVSADGQQTPIDAQGHGAAELITYVRI
jgi:hypothetical protein